MSLDRSKIKVGQLAFCMAMHQTAMSLVMTVAALAGQMLAGAQADLATVPVACLFVGMLATTIPASVVMARWGRRAGFVLGATLGLLGGLVSALAIWRGDLWLLAAGLLLYGFAGGFANYYRFAASEVAAPAFRSKAVSLVLAGGCVAGILGPFMAVQGQNLVVPFTYLGSFLGVALLALVMLGLLAILRLPPPPAPPEEHARSEAPARPLSAILRQPAFLVAVLAAMVGYGVMNLIMVSTPLAMVGCGFAFADSASVIQWHVLAMYVPSFFTGGLIKRFGVLRIMAIGTVLTAAASGVNLLGIAYEHFWGSLVLIGLGWNFLFIGGTTLLLDTYRPSERAKAQAANEFLVFGTVALSALSSGAVYQSGGWELLNIAALMPLAAVFLAIVWLGSRRPAAASA